MQKIISGKKYSTDTAKKVAEWESSFGISDFRYAHEILFLKKTGEHFLYGEGGGLSPYAQPYGTAFGYGEKIIPLSLEEAKAWAEKKCDAEEYSKIFGTVDE